MNKKEAGRHCRYVERDRCQKAEVAEAARKETEAMLINLKTDYEDKVRIYVHLVSLL